MTKRHLTNSLLWLVVTILCWSPISTIANLGLHDDREIQVLAAPLLFLFLMIWDRKRIFVAAEWNIGAGAGLLCGALLAYLAFLRRPSYDDDPSRLVGAALAVVLAWVAAFVLCFGWRSLRSATYPFACLLLLVPIPAVIMDKFITALQHGSAATSYRMMRLVGIPVYAEGMRMALPGIEIEVAPECSGIRSCLALGLVALLASRVGLRYGWNRLALILATIPIAIFMNAVRISVLASLGAYVDRAFLFGRLHHEGGLVFTPLKVALFLTLLVAMQKYETWFTKRKEATPSIDAAATA